MSETLRKALEPHVEKLASAIGWAAAEIAVNEIVRAALATPPVPAGDERDQLATLLHEPCMENWQRLREMGSRNMLTIHAADAHYEMADRLLAAGVSLTEGGNR